MKKVLIWIVFIGVISCGHSHCRRETDDISNEKVLAPEEAYRKIKETESESNSKVWVFKYDGSIQCGAAGMPLEEMIKELDSIKTFGSEKRPDGLMRAQICGASSGITNRFLITKSDLDKATRLGFKLWDFENP
jgi:hypothetical protein